MLLNDYVNCLSIYARSQRGQLFAVGVRFAIDFLSGYQSMMRVYMLRCQKVNTVIQKGQ